MVKSEAATPEEYPAELPPERREAISAVRAVILDNLPEGFQEGMQYSMQYGMISYHVPLDRHQETYNVQPLSVATLASQKNYMSLYLLGVCSDPETERWFEERFAASGKNLGMGRSPPRRRRAADRLAS